MNNHVFTSITDFELFWEAEYEADITGKVPIPPWLKKGFSLEFLRR